MKTTSAVTYKGIAKALKAAEEDGHISKGAVYAFMRELMDAPMSMGFKLDECSEWPSAGAKKLFRDRALRLEALYDALEESFGEV